MSEKESYKKSFDFLNACKKHLILEKPQHSGLIDAIKSAKSKDDLKKVFEKFDWYVNGDVFSKIVKDAQSPTIEQEAKNRESQSDAYLNEALEYQKQVEEEINGTKDKAKYSKGYN